MTRLASAFGESYQKSAQNIRTKSFELGGHTFKVRIPLTKEMEEIEQRINVIDEVQAGERLTKMTASFRNGVTIEGMVVSEDDVVIDGRSTKDLVRTIMSMETRMVEFMKLLVPETGDWDGLTYADIEEEFPMSVQLELMAKINEAIQPGYKEARKN